MNKTGPVDLTLQARSCIVGRIEMQGNWRLNLHKQEEQILSLLSRMQRNSIDGGDEKCLEWSLR